MILFTRARKRLTAAFFVALLAFAHGAMAIETCLETARPAAMLDCHDAGQADLGLLCLTHCQADKQTFDSAKPLAASFLPALIMTPAWAPGAAPGKHATPRTFAEPRAAPPPLTILFARFLV